MIFFLSTLAIFQSYILPGLIVSNKLNGSLIFKVVSIILISLFFNFFLISLLIYLNLYLNVILYIIFLAQIFLIYHLYKDKNFEVNINYNLFIFVKAFILTLIIFALYKNSGNVFYAWDAVVSYNEWAIKFSEGYYPGGMIRPYLIPKIWSMIYVFSSNSDVTLFSKFSTFLFPSLILLMCLDEILIYKKIRDFVKLILFCIFFYLKKNFILTGYVDIPLVSLIYSFFYFYRRKQISMSCYAIFLGFTIKLSAIFIFFYFIISKNKYLIKKIILSTSIFLYFIFLYHSKLDNFFSAAIFNEMDQNKNFNLIYTFKYSLEMLLNQNLIYFLVFSLFGLFINNFTRLILLLYIIPGWVYWSLLLSYDDRNFLFLIPGLIIINSIVIEKFLLKIFPQISNLIYVFDKTIFRSINFKFNSKILFLTIVILISTTLVFNDSSVIKYNELKKNKMIGNTLMNKKLIELIKNNQLTSKNFITDFQLIFFVPALKEYINWNNFLHKDIKNLEEFDYYLIYGHSPKARKIIDKKIYDKQSVIILNLNGFILAGPS